MSFLHTDYAESAEGRCKRGCLITSYIAFVTRFRTRHAVSLLLVSCNHSLPLWEGWGGVRHLSVLRSSNPVLVYLPVQRIACDAQQFGGLFHIAIGLFQGLAYCQSFYVF